MNIFEDADAVLENTRESARELGYHVPKMVKKKVAVAKRKCNSCWGKGLLVASFPGNDGDDRSYTVQCGCVTIKEIEIPESMESIRSEDVDSPAH